jgi:hypothetical protein
MNFPTPDLNTFAVVATILGLILQAGTLLFKKRKKTRALKRVA